MKVIIAGGGTAGHINPGLAIANHIKTKNPEAEIIFIGTEKGLETTLVPREGYKLKLINVMGFKRKLSFQNIKTITELFKGLNQVKKIIKKFKPDIVIGTGGYVCGPVLYVAAKMKIPTLIHEQNVFPGLTNRILSRFVDKVAVNFKESEVYFKHAKEIFHTGNPVKSEILNYVNKNIDKDKKKPLIVIFGGSRGAENINKSVLELITKYYKEDKFNILFSTGTVHFEKIKNAAGQNVPKSIQIVPYIYNMGEVMASADLVVSRAGAITISELTVLGMPSILIPSPYVTANHQEYNARVLEKNVASIVILEKDLSGELLYNRIDELLRDKEQLNKMANNARKMGIKDAGDKIYSIIEKMI